MLQEKNLKAATVALSAEFIAAAGAAGGRTAYKRMGMAAGKFAETQGRMSLDKLKRSKYD